MPGRSPKLTRTQFATLPRITRDDNLLQLMFEYALRTLAMTRGVTRTRLDVALSEVSVGRLKGRIGFTPQRPLYRAWQQDPESVESRRREEYPKFAARTKREGVSSALRRLQRRPEIVSSFFHAPTCANALVCGFTNDGDTMH